MNRVLVSIIVPVYNVEAYVYKCIRSLTNQSLQDIEIICINDCSSDDCLYILEQLAAKDNRVKIIDNKENLGVAQSRNLGLEIAQGEYIAFIDGDDYVDSDYYEKLYKKAKENDSDIVKGLCKMIYPNGTLKEHWYNRTAISAKKEKLFIPIHYNHGFGFSIYKKSFLDGHEIKFCNLKNGEDMVFLLKALCYTKNFDVINDSYYYYYQRPNSASYKYKEENAISVLNHFIYQTEILNNINLKKKDYLEFFAKHIMPAYELWFFKFKKCNFNEQLYKNYVKGLIQIYKLAKYKEAFKNKIYLRALKTEKVEEYLKALSDGEFGIYLIIFNSFSLPLYRCQKSYDGQKTFVFNIPIQSTIKNT